MTLDRNILEAKSKYRFGEAEDCVTFEDRIKFCKTYLAEFDKKGVAPVQHKLPPSGLITVGAQHAYSDYDLDVRGVHEKYTREYIIRALAKELENKNLITFSVEDDLLRNARVTRGTLKVLPPKEIQMMSVVNEDTGVRLIYSMGNNLRHHTSKERI